MSENPDSNAESNDNKNLNELKFTNIMSKTKLPPWAFSQKPTS